MIILAVIMLLCIVVAVIATRNLVLMAKRGTEPLQTGERPRQRLGTIVRIAAKTMLFFVVVAAIVIGVLMYTLRSVTDVKSAASEANRLIVNAGGPGRVREEASQMFRRFRTSGMTPILDFEPSELKEYPAIAALGDMLGIYPGDALGGPGFISIHVGGHTNGFFIEIEDTDSAGNYQKRHDNDSIEVAPSIVVYR